MILLPNSNAVLQDLVYSKLDREISMKMPFWDDIKSHGAEDAVKKIYSDFEPTFGGQSDVALTINIEANKENKEQVSQMFGLLRANVVGAVFLSCFEPLGSGATMPPKFTFSLRDDTSVYIVPSGSDKVIVVFGFQFKEQTDKVIAHVLLQTFKEVRLKDRSLGRAPGAAFSPNPPLELKGFSVNNDSDVLGYISFAIAKGHVSSAAKMEKLAHSLLGFRTYIQYHIKCSKAHFHQRMRGRVKALLQVLNRAKTEKESTQKKTIQGKTFVRNGGAPAAKKW